VVENRLFLRLLAAYAAGIAGLFLWPSLLLYVNTFGAFEGNEILGASVSGASGLAAVLGAVSGIGIGRKMAEQWNKPSVLRFGLGVTALAALAMEHSLGADAGSWTLTVGAWHPVFREQYVAFFLFGLGQQAAWLMFGSLVADLCDVEDARSGRRREGAYSAAFNVAFRLAVAAGALVGGFLLVSSGLKTPNPASASSGASVLRHLLVAAQVASAVGAWALMRRFSLSDGDVRRFQCRAREER
jgi:GPH family glycoside/pentoside/hexuronide:cation symporter